ncbi:MAG: Rieske 2Fe-2S domain-containing protein [Acidobacteriota bacterium]|nr:Rieske 2Fe-2S domain-containing protein [Acidobacteriota bacterium]
MEITLGPLCAIPPGEGRTFEIAGDRIAVFHTRAGQIYAVQADCPHKGGPLSDGLTGGAVVVCPLHSWKFDLSTGAAVFGDCGLKTYPVRLDEVDQILVTQPGSIAQEKIGGSSCNSENSALRKL